MKAAWTPPEEGATVGDGPRILKTLLKGGAGRLARMARPALAAWARPGYFAQPIDWARPRRVVFVSCDWLGDNLWARQVLPALRERFPKARLEVVTRPAAAPLWPDADAVHPRTEIVSDRRRELSDWTGLTAAARALRSDDLDLVIDLTGNRYSALFSFLLRPVRSLGFAGDELASLYSLAVPADHRHEHASARPWRVVSPLLGEVPDPIPAPHLELLAQSDVVGKLELSGRRPLAVLGPGAGWSAKEWPSRRYQALANELEAGGYHVVATGSPNEAGLCRSILRDTEAGREACWPIEETLPLLAQASVLVCNDSALGHLAAALGTHVVALFGPTNPARYEPRGPRVTVLRGGCPHRPEGLTHHCRDTPRYPCEHACWDDLSVENVVAAVGSASVR
jgi:lipopolysaccharide heptosyltransferase II